ncbi:MAG TPA: 1,4-alpha-glucan branching protein domain-containing protein [Myxococcaceae bacterium]|nr:1,4-alpha-glucan branching protein domain-containing protein [Myxococcaceae bacterium]
MTRVERPSGELGSLLLVLHAHLPWVRHPEHPDFLEEDWFFEAVAECYLPLLDVFDRLETEGIDFRLTLTLSPTLLAMLQDPLLLERCARRFERLVALGTRECGRTRGTPELEALAAFHRAFYVARLEQFEALGRDLLAPFRHHAEAGRLELLTCAATHAFLPLLRDHPEALRAQLQVGCEAHRRALGRSPQGIWLPECGFFPGLDALLAEQGLRYFFLESRGVLWARPTPPAGVALPILTPSGLAAFGRDPESAAEVWSAEVGYPGHPDYREFHRDLGFERPFEEVAPWMLPTGVRRATGYRYWRVTGATADKALYDPVQAIARAKAHARDFVTRRVARLGSMQDAPAGFQVLTAPYDAELFGHWWFEGPVFLEAVLRELARADAPIRAVTAPGYLAGHPARILATPAESSWGHGASAETWLDPANDWIQRELPQATEAFVAAVAARAEPDPRARFVLAEAGRELLLAQASDWPFMLRAGTTASYATARIRGHLARMWELLRALDATGEAPVEAGPAPIFPWLDPSVWRPRKASPSSPEC